jgi:hypothetical protein
MFEPLDTGKRRGAASRNLFAGAYGDQREIGEGGVRKMAAD